MAVITLISFSRTFVGLLKDHAVAVFYDLTTRTQSKSSYTTSVDSTGSAGGGVAGALFAQMERTYMLERAAHARAVATAKGRRVGRPSVVSADQLHYAEHLRRAGDTIGEIVVKTGITRSSLYRHLPARPAEPLTAAGLALDDRAPTEPDPAKPAPAGAAASGGGCSWVSWGSGW